MPTTRIATALVSVSLLFSVPGYSQKPVPKTRKPAPTPMPIKVFCSPAKLQQVVANSGNQLQEEARLNALKGYLLQVKWVRVRMIAPTNTDSLFSFSGEDIACVDSKLPNLLFIVPKTKESKVQPILDKAVKNIKGTYLGYWQDESGRKHIKLRFEDFF